MPTVLLKAPLRRRALLKGLGATALAWHLPVPVSAQGSFTISDLGAGLSLIGGAGSNVVVAEAADSVVIVGGGHPEHAEALLAEIRRLTGNKPISAMFNTNWRRENCGLNTLLGPQGTPILAHENTRLWQNADFRAEWQQADYTPWPKDEQANQTFYKNGTMPIGSETIEYGNFGQCSTDGDIYVRFANADVLVVGDMLAPDTYLLLDYVTGGWINGAQKTNTGLLGLAGEATKVIASTGGVLGKAELEAQGALLDHAYAKVAEAFQTGRSLEEFIAADPMAEFRAERGDPTLFLTLLYQGTWYHVPGRAVRNII
jgi:glyoxylase-like metal-dependent hydrolase (beta-lactamase superfamily II)